MRRLAAAMIAGVLLSPEAWAEEGPSVIFFGGQMTDNHWEEMFRPGKLDMLESWFVGVGFGYEWPTRYRKLTIGVEGQVVGHFGRQDHLEFNVPVILRFHPEQPLLRALESVAFGIGLSTTSQDPQTEIDRDGETSKTLIYWMGEADFRLPGREPLLSFRLHHRSDAYGVFATNSGSNALAVGLKWRF